MGGIELIIRIAEEKDIEQLIKMRWDFTVEYDKNEEILQDQFKEFHKECNSFLQLAFKSGQWFIWVAEEQNKIVSHIYIELIQKVPRPGRTTYPFAYMTNVYTCKENRNKGIGSRMLLKINEWASENHYEFIIVWPSDESIDYYKKNGFVHCQEPMEYFPN